MLTFSNELSPEQIERLAMLAEEAGEVIQVVGKILRHGFNSQHPNGGPDNRALLEKELGDLHLCMDMLCAIDLSGGNVIRHTAEKRKSVKKYLHFKQPV